MLASSFCGKHPDIALVLNDLCPVCDWSSIKIQLERAPTPKLFIKFSRKEDVTPLLGLVCEARIQNNCLILEFHFKDHEGTQDMLASLNTQ